MCYQLQVIVRIKATEIMALCNFINSQVQKTCFKGCEDNKKENLCILIKILIDKLKILKS